MSGPEFFQTRMGSIFFQGTMPKLTEAAERIANGLERLAAQGTDHQRDRETVSQMAKDLFNANEEPKENPEYLRGQVELLCSTAELMATKAIDADGLGDQRDQVMVMFDEYREDGADHFAAWVTKFYFKE